jgi:hypothetical protein
VIIIMNHSPSPEEIAAEAREALRRRPPKSSRERFTELIRKGWINARGQVTRLLGGTAEPEPNYETWTAAEDGSGTENGLSGHERFMVREASAEQPR